MVRPRTLLTCLVAAILAAPPVLAAADITVPKDTDIKLVFDQSLSSKTAKVGDSVKMHVAEDLVMDGKTVVKAGTPVSAAISKVEKRKHFGINAKMKFVFNSITSANGATIPIQPKDKPPVGSRTGEAAGASAGGAILLGPVGLVGGYFVVGKQVKIEHGDTMWATVTSDTTLKWK